MKIAVINFSGNVGKTTVARQLLAPRLGAPEFAVESINAGAGDEGGAAERIQGRDFGTLQESLMLLDSAVVDVGASNVEDFVRLMAQFEGSHEEFDRFVVPAVSERKQQADTVNTIRTLASLGVPPWKIRVVLNKVDLGDAYILGERFSILSGFHAKNPCFQLNAQAVIFYNEVYERLRGLNLSVAEAAADTTNYRARVREETDEQVRAEAVSMISVQRLARWAHRNLDAAYAALFEEQAWATHPSRPRAKR
ncbi:StbB family protein [Cupriavidus respiraculi]|uniref:Plasmid stabilization protein n=1 Tax=Cupriavidus respiraculi TaxID=195930 RepID=A0ABM8XV00_9BURK|nr:StbB family protein [Cupriavidus respiraculi]MBY4949547.1 plasmid stabilization protein [Cupriavidus respiraculi]CAG9184031.1 hypothetical protein LMG21510_05006 [Cupriavidus respiraculi]